MIEPLSVRGVPRDQLVVVRLDVMQAVTSYLAQRPYAEVAGLAVHLSELTTLKEHLARPKTEEKS